MNPRKFKLVTKEELMGLKVVSRKMTVGHLLNKSGNYRFDLYTGMGKKRKRRKDGELAAILSKNDTTASQKDTSTNARQQTRNSDAPPNRTPGPAISESTLDSGDHTYESVQSPPIEASQELDVVTLIEMQSEITSLKEEIEKLQQERTEHLTQIGTLKEEVARPQTGVNSHPSNEPPLRDSLSEASVNDVVMLLCEFNMSAYAAKFENEQIDGALLIELDEDILQKELGLSRLDAKRLRIAIEKHK